MLIRAFTLWQSKTIVPQSPFCRKKNDGGLEALARSSVSSDVPCHSTHSVLVNYRATKKRGSWPRSLAKQNSRSSVSIPCSKKKGGGLGALARSSVGSDTPFHSTHSVLVIYCATKKRGSWPDSLAKQNKIVPQSPFFAAKENDGGLGALARSSVSSAIPFHSTHSVLVIYRATKKRGSWPHSLEKQSFLSLQALSKKKMAGV